MKRHEAWLSGAAAIVLITAASALRSGNVDSQPDWIPRAARECRGRLHVDGVFTTAATATVTAGGLLLVHAQIYAPVLPFVITLAVVVTALIFLRPAGAAKDPGHCNIQP